ncbi:MAG: hypothetical protein STSR0007_03930 [Thermovirga sp.]
MPTDLEFNGYLAPSIHWGEGDELFLQPVYLIPVEVFTTGFLSRPEYKTVMATVDAVGGRVSIGPLKKTPAILTGEPDGRRLPVNITLVSAVLDAESAAALEGRDGWRALARSSHVMANESQARGCWKVWARDGESLVDTVTGRSFPVGELLGLFLPQG